MAQMSIAAKCNRPSYHTSHRTCVRDPAMQTAFTRERQRSADSILLPVDSNRQAPHSLYLRSRETAPHCMKCSQRLEVQMARKIRITYMASLFSHLKSNAVASSRRAVHLVSADTTCCSERSHIKLCAGSHLSSKGIMACSSHSLRMRGCTGGEGFGVE